MAAAKSFRSPLRFSPTIIVKVVVGRGGTAAPDETTRGFPLWPARIVLTWPDLLHGSGYFGGPGRDFSTTACGSCCQWPQCRCIARFGFTVMTSTGSTPSTGSAKSSNPWIRECASSTPAGGLRCGMTRWSASSASGASGRCATRCGRYARARHHGVAAGSG